MINLELGLNEVALTLSENTTITNPYYIFSFYSASTKTTKYFTSTDLNKGTEIEYRFNKFSIELVEDLAHEDINNGKIYLSEQGFYEYTIYAQESLSFPPDANAEIVEYGRVFYGFNESTITSYSPDIETIVYNG